MYCKVPNLTKRCSFMGLPIHFTEFTLEFCTFAEAWAPWCCYTQTDYQSAPRLGRALSSLRCSLKTWGDVPITSLCLENVLLSLPTFSQIAEKVARFVASRFWQFKLPRGSGESPDLATKLPSWQRCYCLWRCVHVIGWKKGDIWLAIFCLNKMHLWIGSRQGSLKSFTPKRGQMSL